MKKLIILLTLMFAISADAEDLLVKDWLFQADNKPTEERVKNEIKWAEELAERISKHENAPDMTGELTVLKTLKVHKVHPQNVEVMYLTVRRMKRQIMFKNPLVDFNKVLLIDNPMPQGREPAHEARHRNGYMAPKGGRLLITEGLNPGDAVRELVPKEHAGGSFWRPDLSFDGQKVLFCMNRPEEQAYHIYEIDADGKNFKQLTFGDYDDLDPIYLPDGKIMFSTSRANTYIRCMPYTYAFVLARCDGDGKNIYLISRNSETDYLPSLMNDGKVIYSRWEYTDKGLWRVQSLWQCNPDGRGVFTFWGNQSAWPDHLTEPRAIPGSKKIMFTGLGHHQWFNGSIGIIDQTKGLNFPDGLTKVTADMIWPESGNGPVDPKETDKYHSSGKFRAYESPYPLSEEDFLVSAQPVGSNFQLYLMDVYGNRELIYKGKHHAWHAMPFKPRKMPPRLPDLVEWPGTGKEHKPTKPGVLYTSNVYEGAPDIPKNMVKYMRVIEMDHKTYSTWKKTVQHDGPAVGVSQAESIKKILGTVPVEKDGSVCIEIPSGKQVYFQLLDDQYRCIQNMRSFTGVMPGETRGCLGCHEMKNRTPAQAQPAMSGLAMRKGVAKLTPPPWGDETIGYERFVQPVLDKYCGGCHQGDKNKKAREKLDLTLRESSHHWRGASAFSGRVNTRPDDASPFKEPYLTLVGGVSRWGRGVEKNADGVAVSISGCFKVEGYGQRDPEALKTLKPMTIFSLKSKLLDNATSGKHHKVKIDEASRRRLVAWIDTNGPYLGREELQKMYDPSFPGVDKLQVRPRVRTAPVIDRFNVRQDGDSVAVATGKPILAPVPEPKDIKIISASYGAEGHKARDVTKAMQRMVKQNKSGTVSIGVYNTSLGGDPAPGAKKQLKVTYEVDGKRKSMTLAENSELKFR